MDQNKIIIILKISVTFSQIEPQISNNCKIVKYELHWPFHNIDLKLLKFHNFRPLDNSEWIL